MVSAKGFVLFVSVLLAAGVANAAQYQPNEVIVKYKHGAARTRQSSNELYKYFGVKGVRHFTGINTGTEHWLVAPNQNIENLVAQLKRNPAVEYAHPNYILHTYPIHEGSFSRMDTSNATPEKKRPALKPAPAEVIPPVADPMLGDEYGLAKIGAPQAWQSFHGDKRLIVADIDTGIDYNHVDLSFNLWRNPNPTQGDLVGYDFVHNDGLPFDDNEHGTHTAGTIGAVGGNGKGVSGVAPRVSIMALKFLSAQGGGTLADAIRAIDYAVAHGARIISASWGGKMDPGNPDIQALSDAIKKAGDAGVLFVAAAGNDTSNNDTTPDFPASFNLPNMITVAATDEKDEMAFFSNYGPKSVHVGAPGANILSTKPGNKYQKLSGTSMACPHVTGAAALIWAAHPNWAGKDVKSALLATVDPLPALKGKTVTGGRINVLKALKFNGQRALRSME